MGAEVRFEDGRRGQFDILVDGKLVVTRKGGLLAKLFRKPWPRDEERPGPSCYCGKRGCMETFLSGPGLARDYAANGGTEVRSEEVVTRAEAGEVEALAALDRYEDRLARGLAQAVNLLDPDVIVLGGGLSNLPRLYQSLPARLPAYVFSDRVDTEFRPPRHGDSSGVRGAAWLWHKDEAAEAIPGAGPGAGPGTADP